MTKPPKTATPRSSRRRVGRVSRRRTHQFVEDVELRDGDQQYCMCGLVAENEQHTYQRRKDSDK